VKNGQTLYAHIACWVHNPDFHLQKGKWIKNLHLVHKAVVRLSKNSLIYLCLFSFLKVWMLNS